MSQNGRPQGSFNADYNRKRAAKLYLNGHSQKDIAAKLGVSQSSISNYINDMVKEWREERFGSIDKIMERELEALEQMERDSATIFDGFNPTDDCPTPFESSREAVEWQKNRLKIMEMKHKLLGLYKTRVDIKSENTNVNVQESKEVRDEILSRLTPKSEQ
jgi:transcriptional regulator with XRE-family HTH domain